VDSPFDELQKLAGEAAVTYCAGYPADDRLDPALIDEAVQAAARPRSHCSTSHSPATKNPKGTGRPDLESHRTAGRP
jgi:hypothetical protein